MSSKITEQENKEINDNISKNNELNNSKQKIYSKIDNDLSNLEASEETMMDYTFPKEFLKFDLDKIRDFIEILEEYYQSSLKEENINLAKSVKQRIILLKRLEKEKMKIEANIIYSNQRELVKDKMKEELDNYINITNNEYQSLLKEFEKQEVAMLKTHQQEIDDFKNNFEKKHENQKPKPSKECLNWIKIREYAFKQNKFEKVNEADKEINKLMEKDLKKYNENKQSKLNIEIKKLTHKHNIEKNGLRLKKNSMVEMFNQTKDKNIEQIQKKYEAKLKELKNYQNFEMSNFDKITKGITKPCARIQNIVSSTTGYKEETEDDKNEMKEYEEEKEKEDETEKEKEEGEEIEIGKEDEGEGEGEGEGEEEGEDGNNEKNDQEEENNSIVQENEEKEHFDDNENGEESNNQHNLEE